MPYCIYLRKSRTDVEAEAAGEGETLARHEKTLSELAKRMRLDVACVYKEIVSGETITARPFMRRLLEEVSESRWDGVIVMEVERLARGDTVDQGIVAQTFKYSGTKIITPSKVYDPENEFDEEFFEFGLFMSRREYKTINRRLQRGRLASVMEGKYPASVPPYGYRRKKLEKDKGWTIEPEPEEAEIVRMIFDLYTKGEPSDDGTMSRLGVSLIVRRLNSLGIKPRKSEHWSTATVRDMLINPVYVGMIRWDFRKSKYKMVNGIKVTRRPRSGEENVQLFKGVHSAIIDERTFGRAREFMKINPQRPIGEKTTLKNPLAGLVVCAGCGHRMVRRPYSARTHCDTLICSDTACGNIGSDLELVEARVIEGLKRWLSGYTLEWKKSERAEDSLELSVGIKEKTLEKLKSERDTLEKQLDQTYDLLERRIYTDDTFAERNEKLSARIKRNEAEQKKLADSIKTDRARESGRRMVIPESDGIIEIYPTLTSAKAKNDILKEVIERVDYFKNEKGKRNGKKDNFTLTIYPRLPRS